MNDSHSTRLMSRWDRQDWRVSIFAPGVAILQAMTDIGRTASGLGYTREDALGRCLSETAEHLALSDLRQRGAADGPGQGGPGRGGPGQGGDFRPGDGLSAHPDPQTARRHAFHEAHERSLISRWWDGDLEADYIPQDAVQSLGLQSRIDQSRATASVKRVTRFWRVAADAPVHVVICMSCYATGQDPILGFGTAGGLAAATDKALRENLLMEINLMEVLAARGGHSRLDMSRIEAKIAHYVARCPDRLPDRDIPASALSDPQDGDEAMADGLPPGFHLSEISPGWMGREVWMCRWDRQNASCPKDMASAFM